MRLLCSQHVPELLGFPLQLPHACVLPLVKLEHGYLELGDLLLLPLEGVRQRLQSALVLLARFLEMPLILLPLVVKGALQFLQLDDLLEDALLLGLRSLGQDAQLLFNRFQLPR